MILSLLLHFLLLLSPAAKHDFHTSLSEINYNPKSKSLEITIRLFTDDLEAALTRQNQGKKVHFTGGKNDPADAHLETYLRRHFAIMSPAKQPLPMEFIGKETEVDATWAYVEIPNCQQIKGYTLVNTLLLELFEDQSNLVNIIYPAGRKSFIFNQKERTAAFPF